MFALTTHRTAVAALALGAMPLLARAERCTAHARVSGDDALASAVASELGRAGVALTAATLASCPTADVAVHADGRGGVAVTIESGGRADTRDLGTASVAAAWVDAWLRDDLEWSAAPEAPAITPPAETPRVEAVVGPPAPAPVGPLARMSFQLGYEQTWTGDGSSWQGAGLAACVRRGPWCLGGAAHLAAQRLALQNTGADRADVSALATVAYAIPAGRLQIVPELDAGVGRMSTSRREACAPQMQPCDPATDPACHPAQPMRCADGGGDYVGDQLAGVTYTPRGAARIHVAIPLFAHVWLDGLASATVAPFGHGGTFAARQTPPGVPPEQVALPGEPLAAFQLGVGLRVEDL